MWTLLAKPHLFLRYHQCDDTRRCEHCSIYNSRISAISGRKNSVLRVFLSIQNNEDSTYYCAYEWGYESSFVTLPVPCQNQFRSMSELPSLGAAVGTVSYYVTHWIGSSNWEIRKEFHSEKTNQNDSWRLHWWYEKTIEVTESPLHLTFFRGDSSVTESLSYQTIGTVSCSNSGNNRKGT